MSRDKILQAIRSAQPEEPTIIPLYTVQHHVVDPVQKFMDTLIGIGGAVIRTQSYADVNRYMKEHFSEKRVINLVEGIDHYTTSISDDPHLLDNVDLTIVKGVFAVAENGAVWVTDKEIGDRALPFIASNLIMIVSIDDIVPTLHEAYERIGKATYDFGTFIAGPSKTADIEQSLVLGAHGPKSNTIFLIEQK